MIRLVNADGVARELPRSIMMRSIPTTINVPTARVDEGAARTGTRKVAPKEFELTGELLATRATLGAEIDSLYAFLMRSPLRVYRDTSDTRYLLAELLEAPREYVQPDDAVRLTIRMVALEPYRIADDLTTVTRGTGTGTVTNPGSAPAWPIVRLVGGSSPRISSGSGSAQFLGTNGGSTIVLDTYARTATRNGTNVVGSMTNPFFVGFYLDPGANTITVEGGGSAVFEWYARWW